jgi:hypothetical protein
MFLLFKTVNVASEYVPPSARGTGVSTPGTTEPDVEPEYLSLPIACKSANCV